MLIHALVVSPVPSGPLGPDGGIQIDPKRKDIETKNKRNRPLQHRGGVVVLSEIATSKRDGQDDLDDDKRQLDPEGNAEDAVLAIAHAEPLILPADKDGADDVAGNEQQQKNVVQLGVSRRVEDAQQNQAGGADDGEDDGDSRQDFFRDGGVGDQPALVPEPAVGAEGEVQEDGGDGAAGYE